MGKEIILKKFNQKLFSEIFKFICSLRFVDIKNESHWKKMSEISVLIHLNRDLLAFV